jgi:hypothetical protein
VLYGYGGMKGNRDGVVEKRDVWWDENVRKPILSASKCIREW